MKTYVITFSREFPSTHKRSGEETGFVEKILSGKMKDPKENIENWKDLSFSDLVKLCEMREEFFESVKYNGTIVKGYDLPRHNFRIRL